MLRVEWFVWAVWAPLCVGCTPGGVGDPCTPEEEYSDVFPGFSVNEVSTESASFQCETRLCLVSHFQGRVSCPYGQPAPGAQQSCRLPGSEDAVTVPVSPQLRDRPPESSVYCSCRCDGPDENARYCECPSGYSCEPTVPDFGRGNAQLPGSYCVRAGTRYNSVTTSLTDVCNANLQNCEK
jgi:hypothetical protein